MLIHSSRYMAASFGPGCGKVSSDGEVRAETWPTRRSRGHGEARAEWRTHVRGHHDRGTGRSDLGALVQAGPGRRGSWLPLAVPLGPLDGTRRRLEAILRQDLDFALSYSMADTA